MLLALRSLWESGVATVRRGGGLLLSLQSLVEQLVVSTGDVSFHVTGVAADPQIGEIAAVSGTEETSSGGALQAFRLALQREARRQEKARRNRLFDVDGVAANPVIGEISQVAVTFATPAAVRAGLAARARTARHVLVHVDFAIRGPAPRSRLGHVHAVDADFAVVGSAANPSVSGNLPAVEAEFDLLEDELVALMLAA